MVFPRTRRSASVVAALCVASLGVSGCTSAAPPRGTLVGLFQSERGDLPAPPTPFAASVTILTTGHKLVVTVKSNSQGHFRATLRPGHYLVGPGATAPCLSYDLPVHVTTNAEAHVTLVCHSDVS